MAKQPTHHQSLLQFVQTFLLIFLFAVNSFSSFCQALDEQIRAKLEVVTQYIVSADDNTDEYLDRLNYKRPSSINATEWKAFPAIKKIEMAYKAAAVNQQGDAFIEALSKHVASEYHSVKSEGKLAYHFASNSMPQVQFSNPSTLAGFSAISVPQNIKKEILTVGKYVNEGALGSMQSVMKNYLNLDDEIIYDLLSKSPNNQSAFEQGMVRSRVPPPHESKLATMANDLQSSYKGLQKDNRLTDIAKRNKRSSFSFVDESIKPADISSLSGGGSPPKIKGIDLNEFKERYKSSYTKHTNYERAYTNRSKKFRSMVRFKGGHGGVILGDSVRYDTKLKLTELRWRPINDKETQDYKKLGYLELHFGTTGEYKLFGPVLYEDVFAANAVINDPRYVYGNGIGMVSIIDTSNIHFSNTSRRFGITLHPAVSHLRLGWAFVLVDALATARSSFEKAIAGQNVTDLLRNFYNENNSTWKVTDKQIRISATSNRVNLDPIAITMWGFRGMAETPMISPNFAKLLPYICNSVDEFKRVNEFAKVLSLFRWAKQVNSRITNITTYNSFIHQPICVYVNTDQELVFLKKEEDRAMFEKEKNYFRQILAISAKDQNKIFAAKIDSLATWFKKISQQRERWWTARPNDAPAVARCIAEMSREDSFGLKLMDVVSRRFTDEWIINNVQLVKPDSATYYKRLLNRVTRDLEPLRTIRSQIDSLTIVYYTILDQYPLTVSIQSMPKSVQTKLARIEKQVRDLRARYTNLLYDPVIYAAEEGWKEIQRFENYNHIVSPLRLYNLCVAEKKAIKDYFD